MNKKAQLSSSELEYVDTLRQHVANYSLAKQREIIKLVLDKISTDIQEEAKIAARKRYHERRAAEKEAAKPTIMLKKLSLAPGDIVKLANTRDGHGYREIKSIKGNTIICYQLYGPTPHYIPSYIWGKIQITGKNKFDRTGMTTRHNVNSVTHHRDGKNFVPYDVNG